MWGGLPLDVCVSFVLPNVAIHNVQLAKNGLPRGVAWRRDGAESEAANLVERSECGARVRSVWEQRTVGRGESQRRVRRVSGAKGGGPKRDRRGTRWTGVRRVRCTGTSGACATYLKSEALLQSFGADKDRA